MFAPKQFLALAAILSGIDAACVHRSAGTSLIPQTSSVEVPAYSPSSAVTSSTVTSSSLPAAAPTNGGGELTSTLVASPSAFASNSVAQNIATSSAAAQASASSTSSAASATGSAASGSSSTTSTSSSSDGTKYMVVFGDSYSSNSFYIEGEKPSASSPMGDGSSTTSGGLNWVGMVTEEYNTSTILTYDWAYYGADVSNDIINTGVTTDVIAQVGDFEANLVPAPSYAQWTADNLLVAVWIGINDIGQCFWESSVYATCPIDEVMTKYFSLMQNLYDDGVRNFVVNTVPPFYKAPTFDSQTDLSTLISNLDSYNSKLVSNMAEFKSNNSDITLGQVFNTTSYFWEVFDNPTSYGLDSDITCSNSDGTTCVWYDGYHPGQAIHKLVAQGFVDALTGSFF